jgi:outer membrane protein TolC
VRAAEATLHAASAQVGVAIAARLPNVNLNGALGGTSTALGTLFSGDNTLWSVGAAAGQTVFDGGAARHRERGADAALDQAKAQYRGAVLAAFQNTADVLQAIGQDAEALQYASRAAAAADRSAGLTRTLFAQGQVGALPALNADAAAAQAHSTLIQARAARFTDTIGLFQALGGGWSDADQAAKRGS